jgi:TolA-binding protein
MALRVSLTLGLCHSVVSAQNAPLVSDPAQDQFEFCKQLYREANNTEDQALRVDAYQRAIPRLMTYIERYPDHVNTKAASYYLGECYYQSGSIDEGRRILHGVVNRFREGRYVALASNRLGYDAVNEKKYSQAAVHFGRVATMATTAQERFRGRYQEASCFRYAGNVDEAIQAFALVEAAEEAPINYRDSARLKLAHLYLAKKENDKAREKFEALMKPEIEVKLRIEATLNVGLLALQNKEVEAAAECFETVLLSNEDNFKPSAQAALMNSMYTAKNYQAVLDVMKRAEYPGQSNTLLLAAVLIS